MHGEAGQCFAKTKEQDSEANEYFNRRLYSKHNPHDDDILWIAKSHIYKKLGKQEESETCIKLVTDPLENMATI